jgi:hypothetical protein
VGVTRSAARRYPIQSCFPADRCTRLAVETQARSTAPFNRALDHAVLITPVDHAVLITRSIARLDHAVLITRVDRAARSRGSITPF